SLGVWVAKKTPASVSLQDYKTLWNVTLYADEIYGRKLVIGTDFSSANSTKPFAAYLRLVDEAAGILNVASYLPASTTTDDYSYDTGTVTL
ncbi:hypothetical protein ABTK33_20365, partial [Acinetobacter baumannii]